MDMDRVRIADVITAEYSDFLSFCSASGKIFISELTNVDFVAFRTSSGQSRDYIKSIRAMLDNPVVVATTEVDAVRKGSESEKNELQGVLFDAGKYLALEDQSTPSKTESPSWIQPTEQPVKNLEAVLDETSCSDTENDTENETADRTTEEFVVTSIGTETTASSSTGPSDDSEYTIDADVGRLGVLCDRGKYIHPDYLVVDPSVIDTINDYIEASPRSLIPYGELFDALKEKFDGTQITNRFLLQGALKKYGCRFSTGRDFVRKTKSVTFVDELESFVSDRGIVHKSEIFAEFTSLGEAGLGQVVSRSANVFSIDNGYYIHAEQFDIQPEDYEMLRGYLSEACKEIPVNIRSVYDAVAEQFPEFMYRNDFEDRNKLFAALNYMFREEFSFSRPYIAKLGVNDISNRSVILQHIEDYDSIEIEELIDICDENGIHYVAPAYLCQMIAPDFIRVNRTTLMRRELTGITDEVIEQANSIIRDLLEVNGYIVGSKVNDFLWYPQIDIDWTEFLLENLIVQSKKINVVYMFGDPLQHPNAIYVAEEFGKDTFDSFLIKILTEEVHKGSFTSKVEMRDWLREEGMIEAKLPNFLESAKYFYVNETGVHCTGE